LNSSELDLAKQKNDFEQYRVRRQKKYQELEALNKEFLEKFSINNLRSLTLFDYVPGNKNKDSFSYWVEVVTKELGHITIYAGHFGVYFNKKEDSYKVPRGNTTVAVSTQEAEARALNRIFAA
jgi:hypothetical protein